VLRLKWMFLGSMFGYRLDVYTLVMSEGFGGTVAYQWTAGDVVGLGL
jgi:hypothetical protein